MPDKTVLVAAEHLENSFSGFVTDFIHPPLYDLDAFRFKIAKITIPYGLFATIVDFSVSGNRACNPDGLGVGWNLA